MKMPDFTREEEIIHSVSHAIPAGLSLIGTGFLIHQLLPLNDSLSIIGVTIFGLSLFICFAVSAIYHWVSRFPLKYTLRLCDHFAIYILIGGSYSPFALLNMREGIGFEVFWGVWMIAAFGLVFKFLIRKNLQKYERIDATLYAVLGSAAIFFLSDLTAAVPERGMQLLSIGGLSYLVGIYFYLNKKIAYHHVIWHLFVIAGAAFHFAAVYNYARPPLG